VIYSIDVRIEAPVRDTEVTDRVADAIRNVFPDAEPIHEDGRLVAEGHTLDAFSDVLHEQEILDTARRVFLQNSTDEGFDFSLKKQAAFEGVVNFAVGEPDELGEVNVEVRIREPDVEAFIDYVAPETDEGAPSIPCGSTATESTPRTSTTENSPRRAIGTGWPFADSVAQQRRGGSTDRAENGRIDGAGEQHGGDEVGRHAPVAHGVPEQERPDHREREVPGEDERAGLRPSAGSDAPAARPATTPATRSRSGGRMKSSEPPSASMMRFVDCAPPNTPGDMVSTKCAL